MKEQNQNILRELTPNMKHMSRDSYKHPLTTTPNKSVLDTCETNHQLRLFPLPQANPVKCFTKYFFF